MKATCSSCSKSKLTKGKPKSMASKSKSTSKMSYASPKVSVSFGRKK